MTTASFIVYELVDPRTTSPFYVGKGQPKRPWAHISSAIRWMSEGKPTNGKWGGRNLEKLGVIAEILAAGMSPLTRVVAEYETNEQAVEAERSRIEEIGPAHLTNKVPGNRAKAGVFCRMPQKSRLNYSLNEQTAQALDDYCKSTGRKAAEVARQVILDYLDAGEAIPACIGHPTDKRADLWLQPASMTALDKQVKQEGHISRSALICALLATFLVSRPAPKTVAFTINIPMALWNKLGANPEAAILSAIEDSITDKELIRA